jgi:hypothetical protein
MKLFTVVYNDARLLPHFLRNYAMAGISRFFIAAAPEFVDQVGQFCGSYPITQVAGLDVAESTMGGTAAVTEMRRRYQACDEWVMIVDLDEFIDFREPIEATISTADRESANAVRGIMYDRFSADGGLGDFAPNDDLAKIYPVKSRFFYRVMGCGDHKGVLVRGRMNSVAGVGHHLFEDERLCSKLLEISHYKWIPGALDRLQDAHRRYVEAGIPGEIEYRRALDHYARHNRFAWETFGGQLGDEFVPHVPERCTDCPAPLSEAEYRFSLDRYGKPLCRIDQKNYRAPDRPADADGSLA